MSFERLSDFLMFNTVKITVCEGDCTCTGTAFYLLYEDSLYLVTCRHVVEDAEEGTILLQTKSQDNQNLGNPQEIRIDNFRNIWFSEIIDEKSLDIAVCPIRLICEKTSAIKENDIAYVAIHQYNCLSQYNEKIDVLDEVVFVGYPAEIESEYLRLPLIRKGIITTKFSICSDEFLIDAPAFAGSSGSPVFLYDREVFSTNAGSKILQNAVLLGILSQSCLDYGYQYVNLGKVLKAERIIEVIKKSTSGS